MDTPRDNVDVLNRERRRPLTNTNHTLKMCKSEVPSPQLGAGPERGREGIPESFFTDLRLRDSGSSLCLVYFTASIHPTLSLSFQLEHSSYADSTNGRKVVG